MYIQEPHKGPQNKSKESEIKCPRGCLDELISSQQQLVFNPIEIGTTDEMIHCYTLRQESAAFHEPRETDLPYKDKREFGGDEDRVDAEYH